jgi:hypothetical protein
MALREEALYTREERLLASGLSGYPQARWVPQQLQCIDKPSISAISSSTFLSGICSLTDGHKTSPNGCPGSQCLLVGS